MRTKRTRHALAFSGGPAICGVGQGGRIFQQPAGSPVDDLVGAADDAVEALVDCARCRARVQRRRQRATRGG
jgi:hypothetical protein